MKRITADTHTTVGVITMTCDAERIPTLQRTIDSVARQHTTAEVQHFILIDNCRETLTWLNQSFPKQSQALGWRLVQRTAEEESDNPSQRCSKLRNLGVAELDVQWICFLDDDNSWSADHLQTLLDCAERTGAPAVHSERLLFHHNGDPYLEERYPWVESEERGRFIYTELAARGVYERGSHRQRDRVDKAEPGTSVATMADPAQEPVTFVDPNEWLLSKKLLLSIPFREDVGPPDGHTGLAEDGLFLLDLIKADTSIVSTRRATLNYYLGGFSNAKK
jgi:hypothetical protein